MKLLIPYGKIEMLINFCLLKECLAILLKIGEFIYEKDMKILLET